MRAVEEPVGDTPLVQWTVACVLETYRTTFGTLEPLRQSLDIALPLAADGDFDWPSLSSLQLRRLCAVATYQVWIKSSSERAIPLQRPKDWRVVLYSLSGAITVRQAIYRIIDCFDALDGRFGRMIFRTRDGQAELELDPQTGVRDLPSCLFGLLGVAEFHSLLEWLIAQPIKITRISLASDPGIFGGFGLPPVPFPVDFDGGWTGFVFPAAFLDFPTERRSEDILERSPHSFLFEGGQDHTLTEVAERVRRIAMRELESDQRLPSFEHIARVSGVSPATLRRRLIEQGTSYREIKESCRRELALKLLRYSTLSVEDIAARLDYCDSDAFRRAFRGWTGSSPSMLRKAGLSRQA